MAQHRVAIVIPRTFAVFELGVAVEVFAIRRQFVDDWYDVRICSSSTGPATTTDGGLAAYIQYGVEAIDEADTVIVPQAASLADPAEPAVLKAVAQAYERGARIVSFCDGAFVLAAAGILGGRTATTHWTQAARLAREYPGIRVHSDVLYVDDGQVLTSAGTAAALDLSLHIVRADHGAKIARKVARHVVMAPHRDGGQAQFIESPIPETGQNPSGVHRVIDQLRRHLDQELSVNEMAALAHMSPRNFTRRFREVTGTTPRHWVLHQRISRARELLEETDEPVDRIARLVGFGSAVTFRQRFAHAMQTSPTNYRRAFRGAASGGATEVRPTRDGPAVGTTEP